MPYKEIKSPIKHTHIVLLEELSVYQNLRNFLWCGSYFTRQMKIIIVFLVVLLVAHGRSHPFTCVKSSNVFAPGGTEMRFLNKGAVPLSIYWIDSSGGNVLYSTLATGQSYCQSTLAGHPWLIKTVDNEEVAIYIPLSNKVAYLDIRKFNACYSYMCHCILKMTIL